jgi:hypothetical protein
MMCVCVWLKRYVCHTLHQPTPHRQADTLSAFKRESNKPAHPEPQLGTSSVCVCVCVCLNVASARRVDLAPTHTHTLSLSHTHILAAMRLRLQLTSDVKTGNIGAAISSLASHFPARMATPEGAAVLLHLKQQQLVELLRVGSALAAVEYAGKELASASAEDDEV